MLCPKGAVEKTVKYLFSLIYIICIISAAPGLKQLGASFRPSEGDIEISREMREAAARLTIEAALSTAKIDFEKITLYTDKTEDGSIRINKVTVVSSASEEEIREALGGEDTAYKIEVISG